MESPFQQLVGQSIEQYQIINVLGQGGMGAVLKGFDVTLQREVALKVMHPHLADQPGFAERFLQEARTAARLDHPNIVQVHTFGRYNGMLYIIMKLIPGKNLEQMLRELRAQRKGVVLREALEIIRQLGQAMDYAHRNGVLHRDLKPANVMIEPTPNEGLPFRPVITDLGLAKLAEGGMQTSVGTSMGTPAYMSPEQALGKETSPGSDVYSLGVMMFELCTGQLPFQARTITEAIEAHVHQAPPQPRSIRPDLPEAVEAIILKAMAKDPTRRYRNAGELAQAIAAVRIEEPARTNPTSIESAISLITQYQTNPEPARGQSVLDEFKTPAGLARSLIQVLTPEKQTIDVPLGARGVTIGREADNTVVLSDSQASRHHARVDVTGGFVQVTDLNSTNGTYLGNARLLPGVSERWTEDKALRIGSTWMRLRHVEAINTQGAAAGPIAQSGLPGRAPITQVEAVQTGASTSTSTINVTVAAGQFSVNPGETVSVPVSVQNLGSLVDHYTVTVKGIQTGWLIEPAKMLATMPGEQQEVILTIRPPRSPQSRAGRYPLSVQVTSQQAGSKPVEVAAELTVGSFSEFSSEMRPSKLRGGQKARLILHNKGNAQAVFDVLWTDRGEELAFKPPKASVRVAEDQAVEVPFNAQARQRSLLGAEKTYSFVAQVTAEGGPMQQHSGELVSRALLSGWMLVVPFLLCLGLTSVCLFGVLPLVMPLVQKPEQQAVLPATPDYALTKTVEATQVQGANSATQQAATATTEWRMNDDDKDGITNQQELELNTLPDKRDTDEDGLDDGVEVNTYQTNPLSADTDKDGKKDGAEVEAGTNPLDPNSGAAGSAAVPSPTTSTAGASVDITPATGAGETTGAQPPASAAPTPPAVNAGYTHLAGANQNSMLFYQSSSGNGLTAKMDGSSLVPVQSLSGFMTGWGQIVGTPDGAVFFYEPSGGLGGTAVIDTGGGYSFITEVPNFSPDWTHITPVGSEYLFFYSAITGGGATARLDRSGNYQTIRDDYSGFSSDWTHIVGTPGGALFFYNANTGLGWRAAVDGGGNYIAYGEQAGFSTGWTHIISYGDNGLFFYNQFSGIAATSTLSADGTYQGLRSFDNFSTGWTNIIGLPNYDLIFYNADTGQYDTGFVDADGVFHNQ